MFNGLVTELRRDGYDCETATQMILKSNDSRINIPDPRIIEFLQGEGAGFTLVTTDLRLVKRCGELGINCLKIDQKEIVLRHIESQA
jgi:hypothetical protein